jgi:uncharacterized membrane protein
VLARTTPRQVRSLTAVCCAVLVALALVTASARQIGPRPPGKILYIEGEPRFEMKFIKSALADSGPRVVFLQRTADSKYIRMNVDGPEDLLDGFPRTRADLFRYSAIILGSIEASAFDSGQHRLLAAFVTEHGGGLLALGGTRALGAGGWDGTPISALLPIDAEPKISSKPAIALARLQVEPTTAGLEHPASRLLGRPADSPVWRALPPLSSVNAVYTLKPGATALLTALDAEGREAVVLAVARQGRGRTAAFTVQDSWQWQMQSKPSSSSAHADFWQAFLGWLVEGAPK